MALSRIKKGDSVKIIAGKDKGKIATVQRLLGTKVFLDGIGERKRHSAANRIAPAGKRDVQIPIAVSNVALVVDGKTNKTSRVGILVKPSGEKVRTAKSLKNREIK
jgi:large subunit ribosomal protein L24